MHPSDSSFRGRFVLAKVLILAIHCWSPDSALPDDPFAEDRRRLVETRIATAGVDDERVLEAIRQTPRHEFVPVEQRSRAYFDMALPIGDAQTISSPFIVALMTQEIEPQPTDVVLEIGTGSGYQAAVLSPLVKDVYTIEIVEPLGKTATEVLERLEYDNVHTRIGDGFVGWPEAAPFDKIIVTCSPESVPTPLVEQLREGGMMIIPVGERYQQTLFRMTKRDGQLVREPLRPTLFVPMTGTAEDNRVLQPDPANPVVVNGDFEELITGTEATLDDFVPGWYYGRQVRQMRREEVEIPSRGRGFARFENKTPGLSSHLLQGIAVDGREVALLRLRALCRTEGIRKGPDPDSMPHVAISLYDEKRNDLGHYFVGPFRATRSWRNASRLIEIPPATREVILRVGLFGATGIADFDQISIEKIRDR